MRIDLSPDQRAFLDAVHGAAMITLRADGTPHASRVAVGFVDGRLWSSGTQTRLRTRHLRRDPRCTLFVFDPAFRWLGLETTVTILDGPDAPEQNLALFRMMQGNPTPDGTISWFGTQKTPEGILALMVEEQRLIYEFDITRAYGTLGD